MSCPSSTLPALFPSKLPGAQVTLTFGFGAALNGATLVAVLSITVVALCGLDPDPQLILNGAAVISGSNVLQPVQGGVFGERYQITVIVTTSTPGLEPELIGVLPVGLSSAPVYYNDASFRQQFPAFASKTTYPVPTLTFAWNMGANWISQCPPKCSLLGMRPEQLQQAADLMGAVVTYQLYGPASGGITTASQEGEAPGAVTSATEGSISATFQLPEIGSSAFKSMLLASPPYGRMLFALLQIAASVGAYIPSGRPAWIPP